MKQDAVPHGCMLQSQKWRLTCSINKIKDEHLQRLAAPKPGWYLLTGLQPQLPLDTAFVIPKAAGVFHVWCVPECHCQPLTVHTNATPAH